MEDKARVPVAIKPLEWEYVERKTMTYTAFWADGDVAYYINQSFGSDSYYFRTIRWPEETIYDGDDLPSAKAAAQKDFEARIRSALVPPAVPGEVETKSREGCVGEMTPGRAIYFLERFKREEKMLGPHEQWALDFAIAALSVPLPEIEVSDKLIALWRLLDDIDTLDDACKGDNAEFRNRCYEIQRKRFDIVSGDEFDTLVSVSPSASIEGETP